MKVEIPRLLTATHRTDSHYDYPFPSLSTLAGYAGGHKDVIKLPSLLCESISNREDGASPVANPRYCERSEFSRNEM